NKTGDGNGKTLAQPYGVALGPADPSGNVDVFVTGFLSDNVFRITPQGAVSQIYPNGVPNVLNGPREIAADAAGKIYVTGQLSNNVIRLTPESGGTYSPAVLIQGVQPPPGTTQNANLSGARGLAVDPSGSRVFVAGEVSSDVYQIRIGQPLCGDG